MRASTAIIAIALLASSAALAATVKVTHQGHLVDASDAPITGTVLMKFVLYDAETGGTALWTGEASAGVACSIPVKGGFYSTLLGAGVDGCGTGLTTTQFPAGSSRWLEIFVAGTKLSPRAILQPAPSASTSADTQAFIALLASPGVVNDSQNPVDWSQLKNVPSTVAQGLPASGVAAGSYTNANVSIDAQGRITAASNGAAQGVTQVSAGTGLTGGPITSTGSLGLANTSVVPGSYTNANLTVDAQGRITSAANGTSTAGTGAFATDASATTSCATAGAVRWTGATFQGCNGTDWLVLSGSPASAAGSTTLTFGYTGGDQGFRVPNDVTSITVKLWGAGGSGGGGWAQGYPGGGGGYTTATVAVTPGEILTIIAGEGGKFGSANGVTGAYGGGGGAAVSNTDPNYSGAGGGRSAIRRGLNELVTAGGGGGGGSRNTTTGSEGGGAGGGAVGQAGSQVVNTPAGGGTQTAGGTAGNGTSQGGTAGTAFQGARQGANSYGGAGGGGYYGGGSGGHESGVVMGGGGGGSGFVGGSGVTAGTTTTGVSQAAAGTGDLNYPANVGVGGAPGSAGNNGAVVIQYKSTATTPILAKAAFSFTGADQLFRVPSDVTSMTVKMWGAGGGGGGGWAQGYPGGGGGFSTATVAVTPGELLTVIVGQGGGWGFPSGPNANYGGGGGTAPRSTDNGYGGSGGGRSALRRGATELVTAGGGGGSGSRNSTTGSNAGGAGGGTIGQGGYQTANLAAGGGTSSSGGSAGFGTSTVGTSGLAFQGGRTGSNTYGGGGGGGYYGGGSGGHESGTAMGGGGGGSSFVSGPGVTNGFTLGGFAQSVGQPGDVDYVSGVGVGAAPGGTGGNGLVVFTFASSAVPPAQSKQVFSYSASGDQSFTVPAGVSAITVKLWGAGGAGGSGWAQGYPGGGGGYTAATIAVTPGETLTLVVGQGGVRSCSTGGGTYAYGGGGGCAAGSTDLGYCGGGGGRTALRRASTELLTAGGGGGGGSRNTTGGPENGGAGGGLIGEAGQQMVNTPSGPGTQSTGGTAGLGSSTNGTAGTQFLGGRSGSNSYGGGGGGGYYGGGSGGHESGTIMGGGSGGSSYVQASGTTWSTTQQGWTSTPPGQGDTDYVAGVAVGGAVATVGGNGLAVIRW